AGRIDPEQRVVLAGVADMNRLLRRVLERIGDRATVLVCAPKDEAAAFDALGTLVTAAWAERPLALPTERWHVADRPTEEAQIAVECIARWNGRFAPEDVVIGVADDEVVPALERRFAEESILARPAAGIAFEGTRVERALALAGELLATRSFAAWAAFVRQPDVERVLRAALGERSRAPAALLDDYRTEHLPAALPEEFLFGEDDLRELRRRAAEPDEPVVPARREGLQALLAATRTLFGPAWDGCERPVADWTAPLRAFLAAVFGQPLHVNVNEDHRVIARSLSIAADALAELDVLPSTLANEPVTASATLELLLAAARGQGLPARSPAPGEAVIELCGWLELALDDAPAMVVTGFNEGRVPHATARDPFLPEQLRVELGLAHSDDRLARDAYAARVLLESRKELDCVSGRRTRDGDPLLPSRLVFHGPPEEAVARVRRFYAVKPRPAIPTGRTAPPRDLPRGPTQPVIERISVSAFRTYLASPYLYYLEHVLRLGSADDRARELDPLQYGSLAHDVLADFGRDATARELVDERALAAFLRERLERRAAARYGDRAEPAVALQIERMKHRFDLFAAKEVARRNEGWGVFAVECSPEEDVLLDVDGAPIALSGRIDRIDARGVGREREFALLDYKTGDKAKEPDKAHRSRGAWRDLQLPLYTLIAKALGAANVTQLGYYALGKDAVNCGVKRAPWKPADIDGAILLAKEVVRSIRRGELWDLKRGVGDDPILCAIVGKGLIAEDETPAENGGDNGGEYGEESGEDAEGGA
ncbi:MAG: PD-(D/E)XK nuclease family protein, partial [Planctomycetes bacterium]|nr:PD-(D/E)XK nuclease family protein [Planctomycetota bacterium]